MSSAEAAGLPEDLVTVKIVQGQLIAGLLKARLESEGIPVVLRYESVGRVLGLTFDGLGQVELVVPASQAARAQDLLESDETPPPPGEEL
ncbi:MAG: DUF2007 domain-containing protein [Chloroflexi bacterium]|nr:DUF2007 domain-containing protein [Chloroflexota bacterium]